ncbi:WSCD family member GA21586-like [Littorina saxatilis]|uniref:WSCD family member GA21586-like n=1 Tax=Littorina saxatilis TaxID=31220 RepID=UPI0038B4EE98
MTFLKVRPVTKRKLLLPLLIIVTIGGTVLLCVWPAVPLALPRQLSVSSVASPRPAPSHEHEPLKPKSNSSGPSPCKRNLGFSPVPLPVTALASVHGSGNTWVRHLLQQLTGIYTGSVYNDKQLIRGGFLGESVRDGTVVAIKTHLVEKDHPYERAILIIRNPYDAMFAEFNRRGSNNHVGVAPFRFYIQHWNSFVKQFVSQWLMFHKCWMTFRGPVLLIVYDDLVVSLREHIEKMAEFVEHPSLRINISCALADSTGNFRRVNKMASFKEEVLSADLVKTMNSNIIAVQKMFKKKFPKIAEAMRSWPKNESNYLD